MIEYYFIILIFFVLLYASYIDIKTREVSDILTNSLFVFAILTRLVLGYFYGISYIIEGINGIIFFIGGYAIYRLGQWGGGDAKLIGGMGILFGTTFSINDFMIQYVIALVFGGAIWGIGYSLYLIIKNKVKTKIKYEFSIWLITLLLYFYLKNLQYSIIFLIPFIYSLYPRLKKVENILIKKVNSDKLVEGDWLVEDVKIGNKIIKKRSIGLTLEELDLLKGKKLIVTVKDGIPFVPSFLVALVLITVWIII